MRRRLSQALAATRQVRLNRFDLIALLVITLVASVLRATFFPSAPIFTHGDSQQYYEPARALLDGRGLDLGYKRVPLYPLLIAVSTFLLGENLRGLVVLQHLLGVATALLTYGVGRLTFGRAIGLLSGLAAAVSGGLLLYEQFLMSETLFTFLLTAAIFLYLAGLRRDAIGLYVVSGLAMGLAALTRPHGLLLPVLAPLVGLLVVRGWRARLRALLVASGIAALLLIPWMARNQIVHGTFSVSGGSGSMLVENMAKRNRGQYLFFDRDAPRNEPSRQLWRASRFIQQVADKNADRREEGQEGLGLTGRKLLTWIQAELKVDEREADSILREVALRTIQAQPLTYARLTARQAIQVFSGKPEQLTKHWETQRQRDWPPKLPRVIPPITAEQEQAFPRAEAAIELYQASRFGPLLPVLFVVGVVASALRPNWRAAQLPGLGVFGIYLVSAAIVGFVPRYHYPAEPLLHVLGFGGLLFLLQLGQSARRAFGQASAAAVRPAPPPATGPAPSILPAGNRQE